MAVTVRLIGRPEIRLDDGEPQPLRGHQAWAVLARLLLADRELSRRELSTELFPETVDPLGSLRWCLAGLRRAFDAPDSFASDPIQLNLPANTQVDVTSLERGAFDPDRAAEFLEMVDPTCGPEFDTWLLVQRARIAALIDAQLRAESIRALSSGDPERAVELAERAVRRLPLDEGAHILMVQSLAASGNEAAALAHVQFAEELLLEEAGVAASSALRSAARRSVADPPRGVSAGVLAQSLLDSGTAALAAGAVDAGVDCLRRAVAEAERSQDRQLWSRSLLELGSALVHSIRGFDDEGSVLLAQAAELAAEIGDREMATGARRELGYVDALAGRRPHAAIHLEQALELAGDDADLLAGVHGVIAFNLADWGRSPEALAYYDQSIEFARSAGNDRREAWSLGVGAWAHLQAGDHATAEEWSARCLEMVTDQRWLSFRPWPVAVLTEAALRRGTDPMTARGGLEESFALSCQLADPCWEGATARLIALTHAAENDTDSALDWIVDARVRCLRKTDPYVAMHAAILLTEGRLNLAAGRAAEADATARHLIALAARTHMDGVLEDAMQLVAAAAG